MEQKASRPDPALLEQYRQQMLDMYNRQSPNEEDWLNQRFPEPISIFNRQPATAEEEPPAPTEETENAEAPPLFAETQFVGYLRVFVAAAEGAQPIPDAHVTVMRDGTVYTNAVTDRDGYTPIMPLPSLDPALTLSPANATPYLSYDIRVHSDGFRTVQYDNVPIYGNDYVTQQAFLHPLTYSDNPDDVQNFLSGGPENL